MQATTGCKINVSPASGQDFQREIGLVGTRGSIEQAKRAITDKVNAVVRFDSIWLHENLLIFDRRKRIVLVVERIVMTNTMIDTHIRSSSSRRMANKMQSHHNPKQALVKSWIPMQPMVAIRTTLRCGIQAFKPSRDNNNNNKHCKTKAHQVSRGHPARDVLLRCNLCLLCRL